MPLSLDHPGAFASFDTAGADVALERLERLAQIGHFSFERATGKTTWSPAMLRQFGFPSGTVPGSMAEVTARFHPEDRSGVLERVAKTFETGEGYAFHHRIVRLDGEVRHVWTRGEIEDRDGVMRLVGVSLDVTDIRESEVAMKAEASAYRFMADNTRDLITRVGLDGVLTYISPSALAITGYRPDELIGGRTFFTHVHPDDLGPAIGALKQLYDERASRSAVEMEYRIRHKDGRWVWLEANPRLVLDERGRVLECVDIAREITQRKLDEAALAEARALADTAAATKSEFLANMSHELRTPLTSILGFAGLIGREGGLSETDTRYLGLVREAGRMLLDVVNDILDFSRLEAGAVELRLEPFGLAKFVRDTSDIVRPLAEAKGLRLLVDIEREGDGEVCLLGDAARLKQVLLNLLGNAVKFTDTGSIRVKAKLAEREDAPARLTLSVADTGIGIPATQMEALFDRFSQGDGSISRRFGGAGLGLAITRKLCDLMGGSVGVESAPGVGSVFCVTVALPRAAAPQPEAAPVASEAFERAPQVLVAEDHRVNQTLVRTLLEHLGCEVTIVEDGGAAVEAVQAANYDLVFMDMQMPVMDGVRATRAIRALGGSLATLPIVAMTANVLPEQMAQCRDAGMDGHVAKPIDVAALTATLARHLGDEALERQAA